MVPERSMRPSVLLATLLSSLAVPDARAQFLFGRLTPAHAAVEPNGTSEDTDIAGDGKTVVFASGATNWLPAATTGTRIFAYDLVFDVVENLSISGSGNALNG